MKRFLAVLLALGIPPAVYFTTLEPKRNQRLRGAEAEIAELDKRVEQARAAERKLPQFRDEVRRLDLEIDKLRDILPTAIDLEWVRTKTEAAAERNGVRLTRFEDKAAARPPHSEGEVAGSAEGTAGFLRDIQNASRIIDATSLTMRKDAAGWRTGFVLTTQALQP